MTDTTMDIIQQTATGSAVSGAVAQRLLSQDFNVQALRTCDTLRKNEWIELDKTVVEVARKRLVAVADLMNAGLTYNLADPMGITKLEWETTNDLTDATVSMNGLTQGNADKINFELNSIPVPIIHKDFHINARTLQSSRRIGQPLDTTQAALAARIVAEKIESLLFLGSNVAGTNNKIYGYLTAPNRNTGSVTASWASATGTQILGDVLAMVDKAVADNMYGPYVLYVPNSAYVHMGDDFKTNSDKSIMQRIMEVPGITAVRPSPDLTSSNVVLVQMSREVVDLVDGMQPTVVSWESNGGLQLHFKVLAIMVPRVKSDQATQCGIIHYS